MIFNFSFPCFFKYFLIFPHRNHFAFKIFTHLPSLAGMFCSFRMAKMSIRPGLGIGLLVTVPESNQRNQLAEIPMKWYFFIFFRYFCHMFLIWIKVQVHFCGAWARTADVEMSNISLILRPMIFASYCMLMNVFPCFFHSFSIIFLCECCNFPTFSTCGLHPSMSVFDLFATAAASRDVFDVGSRQLQGFFEDDIDFSFATKAVVCEGMDIPSWY